MTDPRINDIMERWDSVLEKLAEGSTSEFPEFHEVKQSSTTDLPSVKDIVKDNTATFSFYRNGNMFYNVPVAGVTYCFPVSLEDIGSATLLVSFKAITLMRYIRKALKDGTFVKA